MNFLLFFLCFKILDFFLPLCFPSIYLFGCVGSWSCGISSCSAWALWLYCESLVVPRLVGFLVPQPGIEPESPALQGFLATGPPGKSYLLTVDATIDTLLAGLTQPSQELCGSEGHRLHTACCWPVASAQLLAFCAPSRALGSPRHSCVFSQSFSHQLLSKLNHYYINQSSIKARRKGFPSGKESACQCRR